MIFAFRGTLIVLAVAILGLAVWKIPSTGNPAYGLPVVTGPYGTGVAIYHLIDHERMDPHITNDRQPREITAHIWYPVHKGASGKRAPYVANAQVAQIMADDIGARFCHTPQELSFLYTMQTSSFIDVPIAPDKSAYPVLIFSPGAGAPVTIYTNFLQELASHGYIVVGVDYPYVSNPTLLSGDRVVPALTAEERKKVWATDSDDVVGAHEQQLGVQDVAFVIHELEKIQDSDPRGMLPGKLSLDNIGLLGHSFGGGISMAASGNDARIKAVANIDGKATYDSASQSAIRVPTLFIRSPVHSGGKNEKIKTLISESRVPGYYQEVPGMTHSTFSDLFLLPPWNQTAPGPIDVAKGIRFC